MKRSRFNEEQIIGILMADRLSCGPYNAREGHRWRGSD